MNLSQHRILQSWLYIFALVILIINDHVLKHAYPGWITGKISDVAGLLIFFLFLSSFFKNHLPWVVAGIVLFFVWWKSAFSQSAIDAWNSAFLFPISRVVDPTDLWALFILIPGIIVFQHRHQLRTSFIPSYFIVLISLIAFTATSYYKSVNFENDVYFFSYSKNELIERINTLSAKDSLAGNLPVSIHTYNANDTVMDNMDTVYYYVSRYVEVVDTIHQNQTKTDSLIIRKYPVRDSVYLNARGKIIYHCDLKSVFREKDHCEYVPVRIKISGSETLSAVQLLNVEFKNCKTKYSDSEKEKQAIKKAFESYLIKELK